MTRLPFFRSPVLISLLGGLLLVSTNANAQQPDAETRSRTQEGRSGFVMDERPSVRFGDSFRVDLTSAFDFEWRAADERASDGAEFRRRRVGFEGRLFGIIGFEVERELSDARDAWRDVFVEFRKYKALRVRAGRFKMPFGLERLTPVSELDFVRRTTATESLTPGRDTGVQVGGRVFGRGLSYAAGVFLQGGDVSREGTDAPGGRTLAARLTTAPFARAGSKVLRKIEAGVGFASGELPDGLNGWRVRTTSGYEAFSPVYVGGARQRLGFDASLEHGPFAVRGEFLHAQDQRLAQGLSGDDLPDVVAQGWHLSGTWIAVGRLKDGGSAPRQALFRGGAGAIQLGVRVERLGISSDAPWDDVFRNPRAANVLPNDLEAWTAGVNWYPVRHLKLQLNLIREHLEDGERRPEPSRTWTTTRVFRIQFCL